MNDVLPIGTIVSLENSQKLMIVGYMPGVEDKIYLYSAVPYPAGMMLDNNLVLIDFNCKLNVFAQGYTGESTKEFLPGLKKILKSYQNNIFK